MGVVGRVANKVGENPVVKATAEAMMTGTEKILNVPDAIDKAGEAVEKKLKDSSLGKAVNEVCRSTHSSSQLFSPSLSPHLFFVISRVSWSFSGLCHASSLSLVGSRAPRRRALERAGTPHPCLLAQTMEFTDADAVTYLCVFLCWVDDWRGGSDGKG